MNIVLVGLSGSGKTTVGNLLQKYLPEFSFVDTDEIIVKQEKRSINDIFANDGEATFREIEKTVVEKVSKENNLIISTGGGVVLNNTNTDNLKKNGIVFYLKTSPEIIAKRLKEDNTRPLLKADDVTGKLNKMLDVRGKLYEKADFTVNTDFLSPEQAAEFIVKEYKNAESKRKN